MQSLIIAALVLSVAARPATDVWETPEPDALIESLQVIEQRSSQPTKPPKNKQPHGNQGSKPTLTIPTFTFVPISIQTFSMPNLGLNNPKKTISNSQSTVYVPVYISTNSLPSATASRWQAPASPTWPSASYSEPYPSSSTELSWNDELKSMPPDNYIPPPSLVSPEIYVPTSAHVSPAVYVPIPAPTPSFILSQSIAPVLTTIMVTVTRGSMGAPPNVGTLVPQAPKPKKNGGGSSGSDSLDEEDWK
jgi:hypothetical protein